ncbi:hypothetical protein AOLI_G00297670 [Acnodon oligacanthus]
MCPSTGAGPTTSCSHRLRTIRYGYTLTSPCSPCPTTPTLAIMGGTRVPRQTQGHRAWFARSPTHARPVPRIHPVLHGWYSRNAAGMRTVRYGSHTHQPMLAPPGLSQMALA